MYAIVESGGKQYRVQPGEIVKLESLPGDVGTVIELAQVRLVQKDSGLLIGRPWVDHAKVRAEIIQQGRHPSITVFKKKRRKNYRRTKGHRQQFTQVRITEIATA